MISTIEVNKTTNHTTLVSKPCAFNLAKLRSGKPIIWNIVSKFTRPSKDNKEESIQQTEMHLNKRVGEVVVCIERAEDTFL